MHIFKIVSFSFPISCSYTCWMYAVANRKLTNFWSKIVVLCKTFRSRSRSETHLPLSLFLSLSLCCVCVCVPCNKILLKRKMNILFSSIFGYFYIWHVYLAMGTAIQRVWEKEMETVGGKRWTHKWIEWALDYELWAVSMHNILVAAVMATRP